MDPDSPSHFINSRGNPRKRKCESTEPAVVNKVIKNITYNNHNTYNINNYFAPSPAPEAAQGVVMAEKPQEEHLFPSNDRVHRAHSHPRHGSYITSQVKKDGSMVGECINCVKFAIPIDRFVPREANTAVRTRPAFFAAVDKFKEAYAARDLDAATNARAEVDRLRNSRCPSCQASLGHMSPAEKKCKEYYDSQRKQAAAENNGCANQNCPFGARGEGAWCVLQGDHIDQTTKTMALGSCLRWPKLGGVPAMKREVAKGINWICACCHKLEPTSNSGRRNTKEKIDKMPKGKRTGTKRDLLQYKAKQRATVVFHKHQYVDACKRDIGNCVKCSLRVLPGQEPAFTFDHIDETTKIKGKGTVAGKTGGVSGIAANMISLSTMQSYIDAEIAKCQLMCENCHHRKTNRYEDA